MRVDSNGIDKKGALSKSSSAAADASTASKSGKYDNSDVVVLSDLGSLWSRLNGNYDTGRAERISQLAQQYRAGNYVVDNGALGEALISGAFEG